MKYTKIVCTIGPASEKEAMLKKLMKSGMDVARLNFSHGDHKSHGTVINRVRKVAKSLGKHIAIIQDLQGPRIRIGKVGDQGVQLKKGEEVVLVPQGDYKNNGLHKMLPNQYSQLSKEVGRGQHILIADGTIDLKVEKVSLNHIYAKVVVPGIVKSHKGINIPGAKIKASAITAKDKRDVVFGVKKGIQYMTLSFIKNAEDIKSLRKEIIKEQKKQNKHSYIGIIPKIERPEAIEDIDNIIKEADVIMIARGDLGIEIPAAKVPIFQKTIINKCLEAAKPVIVATQMLESMTKNRRPTRAEVSDVANAVIDHTDAVMLSGESAAGDYPLESVQMMMHTAKDTEQSKYDDYVCEFTHKNDGDEALLAHAAHCVLLKRKLNAIIVDGRDQDLVRQVVAHRPETPIIALVSSPQDAQRLSLYRAVLPVAVKGESNKEILKQKIIKKGQKVLIVDRNCMRVETF